jgi:hypothetical protein
MPISSGGEFNATPYYTHTTKLVKLLFYFYKYLTFCSTKSQGQPIESSLRQIEIVSNLDDVPSNGK